MQARDGRLEARIHIPDSAQALVFSFRPRYKVDNNGDKGYVIPLCAADNTALPGARAAMGYFYLRGRSQADIKIKHDVSDALALIESDITAHPKLKKAYWRLYVDASYRNEPEAGRDLVRAEIAQLESQRDLDGSQLSSLQHFHSLLWD